MANHKSAEKRNRQNKTKRASNKYFEKTARTAIKKIRKSSSKKESSEALPEVASLIDRLAKKKLVHKNKAANLKSKLAKKINKLQ